MASFTIDNQPTNNILAPCFTFDSYPEKNENVDYENTYNELVENSLQFDDLIKWNMKQTEIIFVGSIDNANYRTCNTNFVSNFPIKHTIKNFSASSEKFIERKELCNYKYLLHLNGNGGAYSSRIKYLLLSNSLVLYITNYHNNSLLHKEYWMYYDEIFKNIIICEDIDECQNKLLELNENDELSFEISNKGFHNTKDLLKKENVLLYWKLLIEEYTKRLINNDINHPIFQYTYS